MRESMKILVVSPPITAAAMGVWAAGYQQHSRHEVSLLTLLPTVSGKWRMHGGAVTLARRFREQRLAPTCCWQPICWMSTFLALTRDRTCMIFAGAVHARKPANLPAARGWHTTGPMRRQLGSEIITMPLSTMLRCSRRMVCGSIRSFIWIRVHGRTPPSLNISPNTANWGR